MPDFTSIPAFNRAGDERIELPPKVLETPIIPFDQSPIYKYYEGFYPHILYTFIFCFSSFFLLYLQNFTQILQTLLLKNGHLDYFFQKFRKPVISIPLRSISMILLRKTAPVNSHSSVNKFPHCVRFRAPVFLRFWSSPRPISGSPLHVLPHFHSCPIYLILFQGSYFLIGRDISSWEGLHA